MCGIVGIFDLEQSREIDRDLLGRMNESQFHRGPDEGGLFTAPGVGLGHRRLSIIDLSSGQQPLFNEDKNVVVVFNGEIYNFQSLAEELKEKGHTFNTHSDTEVIVHAWEEWGETCVERFRGMFAFAIWDASQRVLFLARDRLGIKPLYYGVTKDGCLIFGSELKALMLHPGFERQVDIRALEDYFTFGYVPDPKTIFSSASKLSPGHTLIIRSGKPVPAEKRYWDLQFVPIDCSDQKALQEELIERLKEAVKVRLIAEVPLGAFLSGGVDSSAVVALMAQIQGEEPVNTCSIGFGDPKYNETEFAQQVANRYHTNHHLEQVDPDDYELIDTLAGMYDEPYADSSAIPTYRVCELAKKRVTVALSGDGGDECFAGYRRHRWHMNEEHIRQRIPGWFRKGVFGTLGNVYPKMDWAPRIFRAKSTLQALSRDSLSAYLHSISVMYDDIRTPLYSRDLKRALQGYTALEVYKDHIKRAPSDHPQSQIQYLDFKTYLPGDILTKVDRASMAHALEVRVPIIDHKFLEWATGIMPELSLKGQEGKYIFKKALEPHVPNDVMYRPKMGFAVPLASWFRGPLRERVRQSILGDNLRETNLFDSTYLKRLVDEHQSGKREHSAAIWSLLMFESFLRNSNCTIDL